MSAVRGGGRGAVTTAALLRLLERGQPEERVAAATILGALAPGTRAVSAALERAWRAAGPAAAPYFLDALAKQRTTDALEVVAPLLAASGPVRDQAARLVGLFGAAAYPALVRVAADAPADARPGIFQAAVASGAPEAARDVAARLRFSDGPGALAVRRMVRPTLPTFDQAARRAYAAELSALVASDDASAAGASAACRLLRKLRSADAARGLVRALAPGRSNAVRLEAALALHATPVRARDRAALTASLRAVGADPSAPAPLRAVVERVLRACGAPRLRDG